MKAMIYFKSRWRSAKKKCNNESEKVKNLFMQKELPEG